MEELQEEFEKCHAAFNARGAELHWKNLDKDTCTVALLHEEIGLAETSQDKDLFMQCFSDVCEFAEDSGDPRYKELEWEMLCRAAKCGHMEASRMLADDYYEGFAPGGEDLDAALRCALEHLKRGGEVDDFESLKLEPEHDCLVDDKMLLWLPKVLAVRPCSECRYVLARCYWDIEDALKDALMLLDEIKTTGTEAELEKALPFYRQSAEEGYFWSQLYFGLYLLLTEDIGSGAAYLENALLHIPETLEPNEKHAENEGTREWLRATIEKVLFKHTGRISGRVRELAERARQDDLSAYIDLAIAYMEGEECPRDREKSFEYASRLLFEDKECTDLLIRMDDLAKEDREWLNAKLYEERNRLEVMN